MAIALDDIREDYAHWQDDGCEVSPSCLSCPLEVCKFDRADSIRAEQRDRLTLYNRIMERRAAGHTYERIAAELGCSRRAVAEACRTLPAKSDAQIPLFGELN